MDAVTRYQAAERLLAEALDLHKLKQKANSNDYNAVRQVRRRGDRIWADVEAHLALVSRGDHQAEAAPAEAPTQEEDHATATPAPRTGRRRKSA